ncbi:MAG: tetratricopeptide repeat protein [Aliarcobacter sp.]|nr:tetratricopeptide repeat protein [Aliarcobacter sp.]
MKKIALLVTTLSLFSYGEVVSEMLFKEETPSVKNLTKIESTLEYKIALNHFKNKNYSESYELFNILFLKDVGNFLINFYLGRSAFEIGKYDDALSAYDRILISDPDNIRVRLELAQTYMLMKLYPQSIKEFKIVLMNTNIPSLVRKKVEDNIVFMSDKDKKDLVSFSTSLGILYDSNINSVNTDLITINNVPIEFEKKSSTIYQGVAQANYKYNVNDNILIDSKATAVVMKYINHKDKDIDALLLNVSPTYFINDYKLSLGILFDKVYLGHNPYQHNYYINPNLTKVLSNSLLYNVGLKMGQINFDKEKDRNADVIELENSFKYLSTNFGLFGFDFIVGREKEVEESSTNVDYKYYSLLLNNSIKFAEDYTLLSSVSYKDSKYKDVDSVFSTKRDDSKIDYSISLLKKLSNSFYLNIAASYIESNSNQEVYDYNKYTFKSNLSWNF